jgi:hypothetical protein
MSNDVMWQILRQHNSHVVKRDGIMLSGEPGNLLNLHSYKFSGLANKNIVHVAADKKDPKKISLIVNKSDSAAAGVCLPCRPLHCVYVACADWTAVCWCVLCRGKGRLQRHPASGRVVTPLSRHRRDRSIRAARVINSATERSFHRRDLTKAAIARYHALYRASKVKEGEGVNVKRRRAGAKAKKATAPATA